MVNILHYFALFVLNIFITSSPPTTSTEIPILKWPRAFYTKYIMRMTDEKGEVPTKAWVDLENDRQIVSYEDDVNVKTYIDGVAYDIFYGSSDEILNKKLCLYLVSANSYKILPPEFWFEWSHFEMKNGIRYDTWKTRQIFSKLDINMILITKNGSGFSIPHSLNIYGWIAILGGSSSDEFSLVYQEFKIRNSLSKQFIYNQIKNLECIPETNFEIDINIYNLLDDSIQSSQKKHNHMNYPDSSNNKFQRMLSLTKNIKPEDDVLKSFRRHIKQENIFDKLSNVIKILNDKIKSVDQYTSGESLNEEEILDDLRLIFEKEKTATVLRDIHDWRGNGAESLKAVRYDKTKFPIIFDWGDDILPEFYSKKIEAYKSGTYEIPRRIDWRELVQHIPKVRSQHICGSCWSHIVATTLEWHVSIYNKVSLTLSTDYMTTCSFKYNNGCYGGSVFDLYFWLTMNNGPVTLQSYGPDKFYADKCHRNKENLDRPLDLKKLLISYKETTVERLKFFVSAFGPVYASMYADTVTLDKYKGGIYSDLECKSDEYSLNHAVVIIGYDTDENGNEYWIIQNSWSKRWGENGYMKISTHQNICGILHHGGVPVL